VARGRGTTYIMVGESLPRHGVARLREPLPQRLMNATPHGVDVRVKKLRPIGVDRRTRVITLEGWSRTGPSVSESDAPSEERALRIVA